MVNDEFIQVERQDEQHLNDAQSIRLSEEDQSESGIPITFKRPEKTLPKLNGFLSSLYVEKKFTFYRLIENTILGFLVFIVRFGKTVCFSIMRPNQLVKYINQEKITPRLTPPFTYLAINCFLIGTFLGSNESSIISIEATRNDLESGISSMSSLRLVVTVLLISVIAILYSYFPAGRSINQRRVHVYLFCYATGFSYFALALMAIVRSAESIFELNYEWPLSVFLWLGALVTSVMPGIILFLGWRQTSAPSFTKKIIITPIFILLGGLILFSGLQANWRSTLWNRLTPVYDRVQCEASTLTRGDDGTQNLSVRLFHSFPTTIFLHREESTALFNKISEDNNTASNEDEIIAVLTIDSWSDGTSKVLSLKPNEFKWINFTATFPLKGPNPNELASYSPTYFLFKSISPGEIHCLINES